jgi:hypothetical protein
MHATRAARTLTGVFACVLLQQQAQQWDSIGR